MDERIAKLEMELEAMRNGQDIRLLENTKRLAFNDVMETGATSGTTGVVKAVDEAGSASYNVADAPDGKVTVEIDGTSYYIPIYNV